MSKAKLKKELQLLSKEQLIEQILDLYDKNKAVKEFYNFYLDPQSENVLAEKYITIIRKEFSKDYPKFSVAKKAISDFKSLSPSPESLANVMMVLPETVCEFTYVYGDMDEPFYNAAYNNFSAALKYIEQNELLKQFKNRAEQCVKWASTSGYGFADEIEDVYLEYYGELK
jgi:hypothetical protein